MKSFSPTNLLSRRLIGAVGLGVALWGLPQSAKAVTVNRGTDYLRTPGKGANIYINSPLNRPVNFKGLAIGTPTDTPPDGGSLGKADTVINRLDNVKAPYLPTLPVTDLIDGNLPANNVTRIQIVGLSLEGIGDDAGKVFVGLNPNPTKVSGGQMAIAHNENEMDDVGGIWSSYFGIHGVVVFANDGVTLKPTGNDYVRELISQCGKASDYACYSFSKGFEDFKQTITLNGGSVGYEANTGFSFKTQDKLWTHLPSEDDILQGDNLVDLELEQNFYLKDLAIHDTGGGGIHGVSGDPFEPDLVGGEPPKPPGPILEPIPEPLTILGSLAALGFGTAFEKKRGKKSKKDQQD
jgi:hypothetical protein